MKKVLTGPNLLILIVPTYALPVDCCIHSVTQTSVTQSWEGLMCYYTVPHLCSLPRHINADENPKRMTATDQTAEPVFIHRFLPGLGL